MKPVSLHAVTWNVHGFVGADRRRDVPRIARVLRSLDADVFALQEVDAHPDSDGFEALASELGYEAVAGPTLARSEGDYGNLLLTRHPLRAVERLDLSEPGVEPRGAIDARLDVGGADVRVIVTHLGLSRHERARQARRLCDSLDAASDDPALVVLLGDLNEWRRPLGRTGLAPLVRRFGRRSAQRTFPARAPLLALDRVLVDRAEARVRFQVERAAAARSASDHLPLRAQIDLER